VLSMMFLESLVVRSTSFGKTSENAGTSKTSSNAKPSDVILSDVNDMIDSSFILNVAKIQKID